MTIISVSFVRAKMYGLLLENVSYYLEERFGKTTWEDIRLRAGVKNRVFISHERYENSVIEDIAGAAAALLGTELGMSKDDFMRYFGTCFVRFFTHHGYDRSIRLMGRHFRDFLMGVDNLHEHMRFSYTKLQAPAFYCSEETSSGLTLHYTSQRTGFTYYVMGIVEEIARTYYDMNIEMKIVSTARIDRHSHSIYRLYFQNTGYQAPLHTSCYTAREVRCETFFGIFPFSCVISRDLTICSAGSALITTLGDSILGSRVDAIFILRRPKSELTWDNVSLFPGIVHEFMAYCRIPK